MTNHKRTNQPFCPKTMVVPATLEAGIWLCLSLWRKIFLFHAGPSASCSALRRPHLGHRPYALVRHVRPAAIKNAQAAAAEGGEAAAAWESRRQPPLQGARPTAVRATVAAPLATWQTAMAARPPAISVTRQEITAMSLATCRASSATCRTPQQTIRRSNMKVANQTVSLVY